MTISQRGWLAAALIVACCGFGAKYLYAGYRNYQGYCSVTGARIPDQQKIDLAIAYLLRNYPHGDSLDRYFGPAAASERDREAERRRPVPYSGIDDFKKVNTNCCRVLAQPNDLEFPPAEPIDRLLGTKSSFVEIQYRLVYVEAPGKRMEQQRTMMVAITNCGVVWNGF